MTVLDNILQVKRAEVATRKQAVSANSLRLSPVFSRTPLSLCTALRNACFGIIAEVKKASPSRGVIRPEFHPVPIASSYAAHGATAISVLTDEQFFQGSLSDLTAVRESVQIPVLRKDFIIDEYQLFEARAVGADAVLLIVSALDPEKLKELKTAARELQLEVLIEVHTAEDLEALPELSGCIIGVNNRDLHTFHTSLDVSFNMRGSLPDRVLCISESGINTGDDLKRLRAAGFHGALVGERLMRETDPGHGLKQMLDTLRDGQPV
jgi:indole-3-glycerol phosphate synthase